MPDLEAWGHEVAIGGGGESVGSRAERLGAGSIRGEEPLCMTRRFELLHVPLPLACGLVGNLRAVIELPVLAMLHPREDLLLCCAVALQLVGDDDPRPIRQPLQ
jgi:hypothetical protein